MKSSVSIVLFLLLSGFFLAALLGAIEHSRKLLALAGGCLVAVVCVIVFLTPVQLPRSLRLGLGDDGSGSTAGSATSVTADFATSVTAGPPATSTVTSTVTSTMTSTATSALISPVTSTSISPVDSVVTTEPFGVQ